MKYLTTLVLLTLCFRVSAQEEFRMSFGGDSVTMKKYYFCMLLRVAADKEDSATAAKIQAAHLEYLGELSKQGKASIIGPMDDDTNWRGIIIFNVSDMKEAEALVAGDPKVKSGRLKYEIHPWWGAKGAMLK